MEPMNDLTLLQTFHRCSHLLHANGKGHGQERILILLLERGPLTQRELIDLTGRCSATLSEQLENMEKSGQITRARNEQDRRNVDLALTESGREAAKKAKVSRIARAGTLFSVLDPSEKEQLLHLLEKLLPAWENLPSEREEHCT
ncbi:MAG: MarR family winged helix-turn-helix transcriptional regulator [Fusicatenibacter sp.]|nr:MarR family transcriptional regulator [Fusicatenibacter sp.]